MIKALFIAVALAAGGGIGAVYAQATPDQAPSGSNAAAPATSAPPQHNAPDPKKVDTKREELGQKLLKRKMELDHERFNIQSVQERARERRQDTPADKKDQKK